MNNRNILLIDTVVIHFAIIIELLRQQHPRRPHCHRLKARAIRTHQGTLKTVRSRPPCLFNLNTAIIIGHRMNRHIYPHGIIRIWVILSFHKVKVRTISTKAYTLWEKTLVGIDRQPTHFQKLSRAKRQRRNHLERKRCILVRAWLRFYYVQCIQCPLFSFYYYFLIINVQWISVY